jgi:HEPN domain-containing protein
MKNLTKNHKWKAWLELALDDLKSAKVLHLNTHYRTSYFLFQQAVEKAYKAFALINNMGDEESFKNVGHDQFKILRKKIVSQQNENMLLSQAMQQSNDLDVLSLGKIMQLEKQDEAFREMLSAIDRLKHEDLVNIPARDLNKLLKEAVDFQGTKFRLLNNLEKIMHSATERDNAFLSQMKGPKMQQAMHELRESLGDKRRSKKIISILRMMIDIATDVSFALYVLHVCSLITIQHSSKTRYPDVGINPHKVYNSKMPLIRKQLEFMEHLEKAIIILERLGKELPKKETRTS